ncbi:MAG: arabinogalactan endo-beta-1,4-galactanase [Prolixibacteraceae bacterium]
MKTRSTLLILITFMLSISSCSEQQAPKQEFMVGADISILKMMEDLGAVYKVNGTPTAPLEIFTSNGYNYARLRIFNNPNMRGPVCNSLDYTIDLAKQTKAAGMKLLLDFHYSDTWADPQHQIKPAAWDSITFEALTDSVFSYSKTVIAAMDAAGVIPDMVQVGNEITPGFIWPDGKIYKDGNEDWESFCTLLNAGINGTKAAYGDIDVPIMIHIDKGGDLNATSKFFHKIEEYGVEYDLIGLSYYPWWHGTFDDLEKNLTWLSEHKTQDIVLVETAYYSNGYYPEPAEWVLDIQPFPPTEQGQYDFLHTLDSIAHIYPKVKGIFYWQPEEIKVPGKKEWVIGRSLFDDDGNVLKGITAIKEN